MSSYHTNNVYDVIAHSYDATEFAIAKRYSYGPTFVGLGQGLKGKRIVDVACGSGFSTQLLVAACRPASVVGVDASEKMIDLAQRHEAENPLGIRYVHGSVPGFDFGQVQPFDAVTALFLLHYASSKAELAAMCRAIYDALPAGGLFVTVTSNPEFPEMKYKKYEVTSTLPSLVEGSPRTVTYWQNGKELCSFGNYYWKAPTLRQALNEAGFGKVVFSQATVSPEGYYRFGEAFWREYLEQPHIIGVVCQK